MSSTDLVQVKIEGRAVIHGGQLFGPGVHNVSEAVGLSLLQAGKGVPAFPSPAYIAEMEARRAPFAQPPPAQEPGLSPDEKALEPAGGQQQLQPPATDPLAGQQAAGAAGEPAKTGEQAGEAGAGAQPPAETQEAGPDDLPDEFPGVKVLRSNGITTFALLEGKTKPELIALDGIADKTADAIGMELYKRAEAAKVTQGA